MGLAIDEESEKGNQHNLIPGEADFGSPSNDKEKRSSEGGSVRAEKLERSDSRAKTEGVKGEEDKEKAAKTSKKFVDEDSRSPEYRSDEWRMKHFKVIPCAKRYAHDWTICPFAHPGEKARRRDPAVFNYAGIACPEMKKAGFCNRADQCSYAHNVFEYWMHPARYRTQLCNDGTACARHVCFFAHTPEEVRVTPLTKATAAAEKREGLFDVDASPDGPFSMAGQSIPSTHSSGQRSLSLSPEDRISPQEVSGVPNGHVGLDFAAARQNHPHAPQDLSSMFSRLLHDSPQDKHEVTQSTSVDESSPEYQAQVLQAIKALDFQEAQLLLKLARAQVKQQAESMNKRGSDAIYALDRMQETPNTPLPMSNFENTLRQQVSPLHTAPAGLHLGENSYQANGGPYAQNRMLSGDLNGLYNPSSMQPSWQNGAMRRYSNHLPDLSRGPSSNIVARMSLGEPNPYTSMPVLGGHGLYQTSSSTSSHNNSALHSQPFRLDDVSAQIGHTPPRANRALTTPVPSAFQQLATQEWKTTPGRGLASQNDLNWRYSGNASIHSGDITRLSEDLASSQAELNKLRQQQDLSRHLPPPWDSRSRSAGIPGLTAPETPDFDLLQQLPLGPQIPNTQQSMNALRSGPYDLAATYANLAQTNLGQNNLGQTGAPWINQGAL